MFSTVEAAIEHYDKQRSKTQRALTIPSQIRQVYHFKQFLDTMCVGSDAGASGKQHYALNSLRRFRKIVDQLGKIEQSNEDQYTNGLNIFSLTLGPFEKEASQEPDGAAEDADEDFIQAVN